MNVRKGFVAAAPWLAALGYLGLTGPLSAVDLSATPSTLTGVPSAAADAGVAGLTQSAPPGPASDASLSALDQSSTPTAQAPTPTAQAPTTTAQASTPTAQVSTFGLMTYQLVPYAESELYLSPAVSFYGQDSSSLSYGSTTDSYNQSSYSNGDFSAAMNYVRHVTDHNRDLDLSINFNPQVSFSNGSGQFKDWDIATSTVTSGSSDSTSVYYGGFFLPNYLETWYWGNRQLCVQDYFTASGSYTQGSNGIFGAPLGTQTNASADDHLEVRAGFGRRVETRWAWDALETVKVLRDNGLLARPLTDMELQDLAGLMARIGSEYNWDFRDQRLHDTRLLWDFFTQRGCVLTSNPDVAVVLSDTYLLWNAARLRGQDAVVVAEVGDAVARMTGYNVQPFSSPTGNPDYYFNHWSNPVPGVAVQMDWSRPWRRDWQGDISERLDYRPYQDKAINFARETIDQSVASVLTTNLGYFPSERLSFTVTDTLDLDTARLEDWNDFSGGNWADGYNVFNCVDTASVGVNFAFTYLFSLSVTTSLTENLQSRWAAKYAGIATGPGSAAFNANFAGRPYSMLSSYVTAVNLTYRIF